MSNETVLNSRSSEPLLKNIKIHFEIRTKFLRQFKVRVGELLKCQQVTKHGNFVTLSKNNVRHASPFSYIIFQSRGYINATGIKSYTLINECVSNFCGVFHLALAHLKPGISIDNITASGQFDLDVDLRSIVLLLQRGPHLAIYNANNYPGLKFKVQKLGTVILFSSGRYTIVGLKCIQDAIAILKPLNAAIIWSHATAMDLKFVKDVDMSRISS